VYGKGDEADDLVGLDEYASPEDEARIREFFLAPASDAMIVLAKQLLRRATTRFVYDVDAYRLSGKPAVAASIAREEHDRNNSDAAVQIRLEYASGHGQTVMRKAQAEPGPAKQVTVHPDGSYEVSEVDTAAWSPPQLRWIGSGRIVYNNKGLAVKQ